MQCDWLLVRHLAVARVDLVNHVVGRRPVDGAPDALRRAENLLAKL